MLGFLNYNFFSDGNALDFVPTNIKNITTTAVSEAIIDNFTITSDPNKPCSSEVPVEWEYDMILNAGFNGNLSGGNIDADFSQIRKVEIRRRKTNEFKWLTIHERVVNDFEDLTFAIKDTLNENNTEYEYAFVPIMKDGSEGDYITTTVFSKFNGVFLGDTETVFRFLYDVNFGTSQMVQQVGTFEPLGRKYPILVANGNLSYQTGSVTATILNDDYSDTGMVDRKAIVDKTKAILAFLSNHKAKVLKDWNGNSFLICVVGNPQINYRNGSGMSIPQLSFSWTEVGDTNNQIDLYNSGLLSIPD